ncbi:hypothetical protein, conserved [Leishmania tarentolae]|uniref:Serine incorporator n=1 Tax=Leishmania tarentolae TaxID=5689 RepID=A0A640KJX3_LEITA|nr:hypothetical protein, conserved [Leishmania tarentolae]
MGEGIAVGLADFNYSSHGDFMLMFLARAAVVSSAYSKSSLGGARCGLSCSHGCLPFVGLLSCFCLGERETRPLSCSRVPSSPACSLVAPLPPSLASHCRPLSVLALYFVTCYSLHAEVTLCKAAVNVCAQTEPCSWLSTQASFYSYLLLSSSHFSSAPGETRATMSDDEDRLLGRRHFRTAGANDDLSPGLIVRLKYAMYLFVALLFSMMAHGLMSSLFDKIPMLEKGCAMSSRGGVVQAACAAEMLIYRVSFALTIFFGIHWLSVSDVTCCIRSTDVAELQRSFFTAKTVLLVVLFILTLFIPNGFFSVYAYVCLVCSGMYLLMNVVFLVDFSYQWSDDWIERADGNSKWMWYLLVIAVGSFLLAIAVIIASFVIYVPHSDCNFNACIITSVIVGAFIYFILSIYVPHGSIVPSGIIFLYTSCILLFTLRTTDNEHCNRMAKRPSSTSYSIFQTVFTMLLTCFTLLYSVVAAGGSGASLNIGENDDGETEDPDETGHLSHYMFFYTIMIFGSMYLAMLGSSWHVSGAGEDGLSKSINLALWVRLSMVWAAMLLYIWSLVAPYTCCKGRDFGFAVDEDWA